MRRLMLQDADALLTRRRALHLLALGGAAVSAWTAPKAWGATQAGSRQRIVCVGGALTEIAYALGAGDALVGVDTTSLYPQAARQLPSVGYARALSSEGVLSLSPTQLIATEDAGPPAVLRQITNAGVPVTILAAHHRIEGTLERIQRMGQLLDRTAQAAQLASRLQGEWRRVQQTIQARTGPAPRVLFILSHSPNQVMVGGGNTSAEAMIQYAGALNAVHQIDGFKPLTPEAVIAARPDVVLATDQGLQASGGIDGILRLPGLAQTPAGQKRRVVSMEAVYLLGFGPRLPEAVASLDQALKKALIA